MDRLRALETFVAVADGGSFAAAARALAMSPPSVTRIIADLEADLGVILLHRSTRQLKLTDVGANYVVDARRILGEVEAANASAKGAHRAPSGLLRVTAPTLFGQMYVSPILTEFLALYPDVRVEAVYLDRVVDMLGEGIDVALRIGELPDSTLTAMKVGEVRPTICASPAYLKRCGTPRKPADLLDHELIMANYSNARAEWRFANDERLAIKPRLVFTSVAAAIEAARSGWGVTRTLSYQIAPDIPAGRLQPILNEYAADPAPVHIVHGEGRRASAKLRAFVDLAAARLRGNSFLNQPPPQGRAATISARDKRSPKFLKQHNSSLKT